MASADHRLIHTPQPDGERAPNILRSAQGHDQEARAGAIWQAKCIIVPIVRGITRSRRIIVLSLRARQTHGPRGIAWRGSVPEGEDFVGGGLLETKTTPPSSSEPSLPIGEESRRRDAADAHHHQQ